MHAQFRRIKINCRELARQFEATEQAMRRFEKAYRKLAPKLEKLNKQYLKVVQTARLIG